MAKYTYSGPVQHVTLRKGDATQDVALIPGRETPDLDTAHPLVASLIASGRLKPVTTTTAKPAKTAAAKEES